jgi:3-deoxy-D-manno-octulosonate 8-phosphate phosphatase (KDO 8-P phosphatase)
VIYKVLALDVDGVLTDGAIYVDSGGDETLRFHVLDGLAIHRWCEAGNLCVWITGRRSKAVKTRAASLGINHLLIGIVDKAAEMTRLLADTGYTWDQVVYVGDDLPDIEPIRRAGLGVAVQSAVREVKEVAIMTTCTPGGQGAVREVVDLLLTGESPE